jgi:hypothetical protein
MPCKSCEERWRIVLAQQSKQQNINIMKESKKNEADVSVVGEEIVKAVGKPTKLDFNKLVEDRRKVLLEGKIINK